MNIIMQLSFEKKPKTYIRKLYFFNIDPELYLNIINSSSAFMKKFNHEMGKSILKQLESLKESVKVSINNNKSSKKNLSEEFEKNYQLYEYNSLFILQYKFTKNKNKENIDENSFEIITKTKFMEYKDKSFKYLEKDLKSNKKINDKIFQEELYIKYKYELDKLNFFLELDKQKIINIFKKNILNKNKNQNINLLPSLIIKSLSNKKNNFNKLKRINYNNNNKITNKETDTKIMDTITKFSNVLDFNLPNGNNKEKYEIIKKINVEPKYFLDFTFEIDSGYIYNKEKLIKQSGGDPFSIFTFACIIIFYVVCILAAMYIAFWAIVILRAAILVAIKK